MSFAAHCEHSVAPESCREFLYMDPETGDMDVYIFDGEVCRRADGEDILESFKPVRLVVDEALSQTDVAELDLEGELDEFIRRHEGAYR